MVISSKTLLSFIILISLGIIWGTGYSIARFAITNGVPPLGYSFWQSLGPAIAIGIIAFYKNKSFNITPSRTRYYFICGLTGIAIPNTSMYFAAAHLPASILAMIVNIVPIIAYPMAIFVNLERFNWQRFIGIVCAIIGLMLIILPKSSLPSSQSVPWVFSTLITPLSFAFCSIYIGKCRPKESDTLTLTAGMLIASTLLLLPLVFLKDNFYLFHFPFTTPDWIILLEIILSSLGYLLFFQLIKIAGPVFYSLVDTIVVLTGMFWGFIIFNEHLNKWTGTAVIFILMALFLVTRLQTKVNLSTVSNKDTSPEEARA